MSEQTTTGLRNADLAQLAELLKSQHTRRHDIVASANAIRVEGGVLIVSGADKEITLDGVTDVDGRYTINTVATEGLSSKLGIPVGYLRDMQAVNVDLFDQNINGWLAHSRHAGRRFLVRTLKDHEGGQGVARAFLSDRYRIIDNLDVLLATLDGVREAGVNIGAGDIQCDLTERNMRVRVVCREVQALAPDLVDTYRSVAGLHGRDYPIVWAGFELANSEVGAGQFSLTPRITWQVCTNGQTMTKDAIGKTHLGGRLEQDGVVQWSQATLQANLDLVRRQTVDAVTAFLNVDYVNRTLDSIRALAGKPVEATTVVQAVAKKLQYTDAQTATILDHFIRGGQVTAGGVMQAVTSAAQLETDGDAAAALEASAFEALRVAALSGR